MATYIKEFDYNYFNNAVDITQLPFGISIPANCPIKHSKIELITPFAAPSYSQLSVAIGNSTATQKYLLVFVADSGVGLETNGIDAPTISYVESSTTDTPITLGVFTDSTAPLTAGRIRCTVNIDLDVRIWDAGTSLWDRMFLNPNTVTGANITLPVFMPANSFLKAIYFDPSSTQTLTVSDTVGGSGNVVAAKSYVPGDTDNNTIILNKVYPFDTTLYIEGSTGTLSITIF